MFKITFKLKKPENNILIRKKNSKEILIINHKEAKMEKINTDCK